MAEEEQKMKVTKKGIKLPSRRGGFFGYVYVSKDMARKSFPWIEDWGKLPEDGYDLGELASNREMLLHHLPIYLRRPWNACSYKEQKELDAWLNNWR